MTDFKKGDRIVFTRDDAWWVGGELVARMPAGTLGTYLGTRAWREAAPWVRLDTGEHVLAWADRIAPAEDHGTGDGSASDIPAPVVDDLWDAKDRVQREVAAEVFTAPAPLDRSKVKAGDTVTVRVEEEYAHTTHPAYTISDTTAYGDPVMVGPFVLDQEHITLLDHQPAPEPEPEWKPTTVYAAASADGPVRLYRNKGIDRDYWLDAGGDMVPDEAVSKVRPLVVIDPADVDVDMLVDTAHNNGMTRREIVEHVLGNLGLNR
jgi:hypothetical protein